MPIYAIVKNGFEVYDDNGNEYVIEIGSELIFHFQHRDEFRFSVKCLQGTGKSGISLFRDEFEWLEGEKY